MPRDNAIEHNQVSNEYHTSFSLLLTLLCIGVMGYLGMKYIGSGIEKERTWATFALLHMTYAIVGGIIAPLLFTGTVKPTKKLDATSFLYALIIFIATSFYQSFVFSLSITGTDRLFYHVFSGVSETLFYQGFLISLFERMIPEKWGKWVGVFISATIFMAGHVSYWGNPTKLLIAFGAGLMFNLFYVLWHDLLALMVAHIINNLGASGVLIPK